MLRAGYAVEYDMVPPTELATRWKRGASPGSIIAASSTARPATKKPRRKD